MEGFKDSRFENKERIVIPSVQVVLVRQGERGTEVFLGLRKAGGFQNQWGVPGGQIDDGETPEAAARRELQEETGIEITESELKFLNHSSSVTVRNKEGEDREYQYDIDVYLLDAQNYDPKLSSSDEYYEMKWIPVSEALQMHEQAVHDAGADVYPDKIPGALTPRVVEILKAL